MNAALRGPFRGRMRAVESPEHRAESATDRLAVILAHLHDDRGNLFGVRDLGERGHGAAANPHDAAAMRPADQQHAPLHLQHDERLPAPERIPRQDENHARWRSPAGAHHGRQATASLCDSTANSGEKHDQTHDARKRRQRPPKASARNNLG